MPTSIGSDQTNIFIFMTLDESRKLCVVHVDMQTSVKNSIPFNLPPRNLNLIPQTTSHDSLHEGPLAVDAYCDHRGDSKRLRVPLDEGSGKRI